MSLSKDKKNIFILSETQQQRQVIYIRYLVPSYYIPTFILYKKLSNKKLVDFAEKLLVYFVETFEDIYT